MSRYRCQTRLVARRDGETARAWEGRGGLKGDSVEFFSIEQLHQMEHEMNLEFLSNE